MLKENIPTGATLHLDGETTLMNADEATQLHNEIIRLIRKATNLVYEIGTRLAVMRDRRGWFALGYDNMDLYISDIKQMARRHAYSCLRLHKCYVDRLRDIPDIDDELIAETPYTKMLTVSRFILDKDNTGNWKYNDDTVIEWVHKAHTALNIDDLKREVTDFLKRKKGIRPDPLVIKTKPGVRFHHGKQSSDGTWSVMFTHFLPIWNISIQNMAAELKNKTFTLILTEDEQ